jgi:hypothetical protein
MLKSLTFADRILIVFTAVVAVSSFSLITLFSPAGASILVEVNGLSVYKASLRQDSEFSVKGTRGELLLEVRDGGIRVVRADCPNRICVRTGSRSHSGDVIVCVPNKVVIRVGSNQASRVGGITG